MNQDAIILMGIEIGGTKLQIATCDETGNFKLQIRRNINPDAGASGIRTQIETSIAEINPGTITAVGVGFGGPVDWRSGIIQTSHQVSGWSQFNLKDWLQKITGAPVAIDNDANVAALAEATQGAGKGCDPVFYMTIGSGIGGGMVSNGTIYHGAIPGEVEIGHLRLSKNGNTLEAACSGWAVNKKIREHIKNQPQSLLAQAAARHTGPEAALLKPAFEKGDPDARQLLNTIADDLAFALSHVVHLFHPKIIVIGGGLSLLGEILRRPVSERLPHYIMAAFLPPPVVALALLDVNVVPAGALLLAKNLFQNTKQTT